MARAFSVQSAQGTPMASFAGVFVVFCFVCSIIPLRPFFGLSSSPATPLLRGQLPPLKSEAQNDHHMDQATCSAEFSLLYPQLTQNSLAWKQRGGIQQKDIQSASENCRHGCVHLVIKDGQIFIRNQVKDWQSRVRSTLQLLRTAYEGANPTEQALMEGTELVISTADFDGFSAGNGAGWVLDKRVSDQPGQYLFPDFSFSSWPEAGIPSYPEFRRFAKQVNADYPWNKKSNKAFWRGDALKNSNIAARNSLLQVATGPESQSWSDVKRTSFWESGPDIGEIVTPWDHCKNKFLVHSEGVAYSGRSKFLLNCESTVIMHQLEWTQHFHPALISDPSSTDRNIITLPGKYFENLPQVMTDLINAEKSSTSQGKQIAQNAKRTLTERYLTPASISCYIRAALISYNSVLDKSSWPNRSGPQLIQGSGVKPGAGTPKGSLKDLGVQGDIELGVWENLGQPEWPPK